MKIRILAVGKMKHAAFAEVAADYQKRIQKFLPCEVQEIPDEKIPPKVPAGPGLAKEAARIEKTLKPGAHVVILDEKGIQWSSVDLAWELQQMMNSSADEIAFVIGGAYGLDEKFKAQAKHRWSLSKLTLPHRLARVLTLEQIYRALTILRNVPYHNES